MEILHMPYLGKRTYIQSTQLLNYVINTIYHGSYDKLLLKFEAMLSSKMECIISDKIIDKPYHALCIIEKATEKKYIYFMSIDDSYQERIVDNTAEIFNSFNFQYTDNHSILLGQITLDIFYAMLIELNKQTAIKITQKKEKWLVVQIEITNSSFLSHHINKIEIKKLNCIANSILRSEILVNNEKIGTTVYKRI